MRWHQRYFYQRQDQTSGSSPAESRLEHRNPFEHPRKPVSRDRDREQWRVARSRRLKHYGNPGTENGSEGRLFRSRCGGYGPCPDRAG